MGRRLFFCLFDALVIGVFNVKKTQLALVISVLSGAPAHAYDVISTLPYAIGSGKPNIDARLRFESVDQSNLVKDADALTARIRLGYTTGKWNAFDSQIELENVTAIGDDGFNSTKNGRTQFPVVADPEGTEVNQLWIRYTGLPGTAIKFGRQRIIYDNHRFLGNVGWRQNEQTYDGVNLTGTWIPKLTLNYSYLTNVNSFRYNVINGNNVADIDLKGSHFINLAYRPSKLFGLTTYAYLLDFAANPPPATLNNPRRDTATYGLRATGTVPLNGIKLDYAFEYAHQSDYADAPAGIDANYYLAEVAAAYKQVNAKIGYEVLGGDGRYGFQTPLATLHAFQGWADQFLVTPAAGIQDFYVSVGGKVEKVALTAVWHNFNPDDRSGQRYGSEIDAQAVRPLGKNFSVGLKFALYNADHFPAAGGRAFDTKKYFAWLKYKL